MHPVPCESELIRQAVQGDRGSLSQLLLLHYDDLQRHVAQRVTQELGGILPVEDVLQETFYRAARVLDSFECRGDGSFRAWLKTIASNLIKDALKRRRRERRVTTSLPAQAESSWMALLDRLSADTTSPSRRVCRRDSISRMRTALASLPDDQREVIHRYYLRDESLEQIALAMDRTKDSIRGICFRARRNLRTMMGHSSKYLSG